MVGYYRLNDLGFRLEGGAYVLPRDALEALDAANDLVSTAEARRDEILEEAEAAYAEERRRGYEDGMNEARTEALRTLLHESLELDKGLHVVERDLVRVVSDCVRKIIAGYNEADLVHSLVREALQEMRRERSAELRVPANLYGYFKQRVDQILSEFPEVELLDVVLDSALASDQAVLETMIGRVEINVSRRLDDILSVIQSAHIKTTADSLDALRASHSGAET